MVELENVGVMITIFLIVTGLMLTAISKQEPDEDFGIVSDFNIMTVDDSDVSELLDKFNSDVEQVAKSTLSSQIYYGGSAIVTGSRIIFQILITALTGWTAILNGLFAPITPDTNPVRLLLGPIKVILAIIMVFTIMKFLGNVVKSLPFFGGG